MDFSKYTGCGNDFILIDNRSSLFFPDRQLISALCHRQQGIGADGFILLENSSQADYRMRIFNSDGGEAEMCGNGIRCLMRFLLDLGEPQRPYLIETMERLVRLSCLGEAVTAEMGDPTEVRWRLALEPHEIHHLNTGVPHAVLCVEDLEQIDLEGLGRALRFHPSWGTQGANINFISRSRGRLAYRTYERGVEGETLACGTGAVAVALTASELWNLPSPLQVWTRSGEALEIGFQKVQGQYRHVTMTGPATRVFTGTLCSVFLSRLRIQWGICQS